jgi:hypothetical protein
VTAVHTSTCFVLRYEDGTRIHDDDDAHYPEAEALAEVAVQHAEAADWDGPVALYTAVPVDQCTEIVCDGCGDSLDDDGTTQHFPTPEDVAVGLKAAEWTAVGALHYCGGCGS